MKSFEAEYFAGNKILGEGMSGLVELYFNRQTLRPVAVKTLQFDNIGPGRKSMILAEVEIYLKLQHPHIVDLIEVFHEPNRILLVMEVCSGGELYERLSKKERYDERTAAKVTKQMLSAISYLHSLNIVHRDCKLENWLYSDDDEDGQIKLCDFGFAAFVHQNTFLTATLGSLHYVAPEVLAGKYDERCDVWSVGIIVYMLLSGQPPFDGPTDAAIMDLIKAGEVQMTGHRWGAISPTAKSFIKTLLKTEPQERPSALEALNHEWLDDYISAERELPRLSGFLPINRSVVDSLYAFGASAALHKAALGLISGLTLEQHRELELQYEKVDQALDGLLDVVQFSSLLKPYISNQAYDSFASLICNPSELVPYRQLLIAAAVERGVPKRRPVTRVHSGPSDLTPIYQPPGFYRTRLKPF